ncbi:hypothetical protein GCK72_007098 [Caenorhabditis remanei]|uniref:Homeobox domain-containing protein n=1 Tax=Caenorhabditis remanei TaxID=31234 RepID=A0A6A5HIA1_CAERE|nr:hypothetical protein GCK72_007098 [Caenorhabditis remanei]KAF1767139.1 hypothetical protein GCK72_007098 [Caenorhabditis remanei]
MSFVFNVISKSQNEENVEPMDPFKESTMDASPIKKTDSSLQVNQQDSSKIIESPKPAEDGFVNLPSPSAKMTPIWTGGIRGSERVATKKSQLEEVKRTLQEKEKPQMKPSASVVCKPPTPAPSPPTSASKSPAPKSPKLHPVWTGGVRGSTRVAEKMSVLELEVEKQRAEEKIKALKKLPKICQKCAEAKRNKRKLSTSTPSDPMERVWNKPIPDFSDSKRWVKIKLPEGVEMSSSESFDSPISWKKKVEDLKVSLEAVMNSNPNSPEELERNREILEKGQAVMLELLVNQASSPPESKEVLVSMFPFVKFEKQIFPATSPEVEADRASSVSPMREDRSSSSSSTTSSGSLSWPQGNQMVAQMFRNEQEATFYASSAPTFYQAHRSLQHPDFSNNYQWNHFYASLNPCHPQYPTYYTMQVPSQPKNLNNTSRFLKNEYHSSHTEQHLIKQQRLQKWKVIFKKNPFPSKEELKHLAEEAGMKKN